MNDYDKQATRVSRTMKDLRELAEPLRAHNFCYGQGCTNEREHGSAYCLSCARLILRNLGVLAGLAPVPVQLEFTKNRPEDRAGVTGLHKDILNPPPLEFEAEDSFRLSTKTPSLRGEK